MTSFVVWVCIMFTGSGPVVIDNIASEANCRGLIAAYAQHSSLASGSCIAVRKTAPAK